MPKGIPKSGINSGWFKKGTAPIKGYQKGHTVWVGRKHTSEAKEKMRQYQLKHGGSNPHRFKNGHTTNVSGESKKVILKRAWAKYKANNEDKIKNNHLMKKYGITLDAYNEMLKNQGGNCAVCFQPPRNKWNKLFTDHDHKTGKVRALLCYRCNTALGMVEDNPNTLSELMNYLLRFQ